jgi:hypothetical protein
MADPRGWISQIKVETPPDLWSEVIERTSATPVDGAAGLGRGWVGRPGTPRRAALVTGVAAGILAMTLVVVGLQGRPTGDHGTPTLQASSLSEAHELLERMLSNLWVLESRRGELQGELEVGQDELDALRDEAGPDPTETQLLEIQRWEELIGSWTRSIVAHGAQISELRTRVEQVRERRTQFLPPSNHQAYPDLATVTCDGDGLGGTQLSTPVVRARADGVHMRVVNRFPNERAFLVVDDVVAHELRPSTTADVVLQSRPSGDVEVVCTYDEPPYGFPRPRHPIWIASGEDGIRTESPSPSVTMLDPLTLTASLDEPGVTWTEVARIPAGEDETGVGIQPCFHCGDQELPTSLAVGRDGTYWIADPYKRRIAHFHADGSFLEAFATEAGPADLTFVGDRLYMLLTEGGSMIASLGPDGLEAPITVNHEGRPLQVQALIGGQDELLVLVSGAERLLGGYWAFAIVDPMTGQVTPSSGLSDGGSRVGLVPLLDEPPGTFEIRWFPAQDELGLVAAQDVRFQLERDGRELRTTVGDTYLRVSTRRGVATLMSIGDGQGIPVGVWYLEITPEGGAPTFERIAEAGLGGTANNRRYLTVGPDGDVYLMRLFDDGVGIYRR